MRVRLYLIMRVGLLLGCVVQSTQASETIKVGATVSLSGKYAILGKELRDGMQMWVDDLNARGALLGRKVELIYYDDASDRDTCAQFYKHLIDNDKVDLLLGPYSSGLTFAASDVAEHHNFPMVATGAASNEIWSRGYRNIFGIGALASDYMDLVPPFMKENGLTRIALIHASNEFAREVAQGIRTEAVTHGLDIVFSEEYNKDSSEFAGLVQRIRRTNPDVVIGGTYLDDSVAFMRQAKANGFTPKAFIFTVGPALREFGDNLGQDAEGIMGVVAWMRSARVPKAHDFSYRYKARYGYNAGVHAAYGYGAGQVLEAAVRLAGSMDKDKIRKQLGTLKFRSLFGHYRVDANGKQIGKQTYIMQWQNGRRRLVLPESIAESSMAFPLKSWSAH